ncbi:MAG: hypothetical protein JWO38_3416 [Gemmataceae bacterium]|nr:hypothetical protein [Gemmataceae bacterium]
MRQVSGRLVAAVVLVGWSAGLWGGNTAAAQPPVGERTEQLLKDAKLDYRKAKDGVYRVVVEGKNGTSVIVVEEKKASWKDNKGNDVLYAYLWCEILPLGNDFKPPPPMLLRLAELNDRIRFGSVGISKNPDGASSLYRNGTLFLRGADGEQMADMVFISHGDRLNFQKEFRGFVDEGK